MSLGRTYKLASTGMKIPAVGLGTWQSKPGEVKAAVATALKVGYRHIDCAWIYGNEKEVGQALAETDIPREKLWITSKLWNSYHDPADVDAIVEETLANLQLSYLDLYLMHWPVAFGKPPNGKISKTPKDSNGKVILDRSLTEDPTPTWRALEALVEKGKIKHIGISNFNIRRCEQLLKNAKIKPAFNQVELNFSNPQPELLKWSKENGVVLQAYSPLGSTGAKERDHPEIVKLAKKHNVDPANVLISWQVQRGAVCLPKSVTPSRIESNFKDVELSEEDLATLEKAAASHPPKRTVDPSEAWGLDIFEDAKQKARM